MAAPKYRANITHTEADCVSQIQAGQLEMTKVSAGTLSNFNKAWNCVSVPYVFNDKDHLYNVMNGEIGQDLYNLTESDGFIGLAWLESGTRCFYTAKTPIRTPADLKGLKIRTMDSQMAIDMMNAFGGSATVMGYGDISTFTDELLRYVLIIAGFIGSAYCFYRDEHLALTLITDKAKGPFKVVLDVFIEICILFFVIYVFIYGGWKLSATATNVSSVMHIPMKTLYLIEPICGVLIVLARVLKYAQMIADKKGAKQ